MTQQEQRPDNERDVYNTKLEASRNKFMDEIESMPRHEIISQASRIAAVQACYDELMDADEDEMLYLLQFQDPLMAVVSGYGAMIETVTGDDILEIVYEMQDDPNTLMKFPLDADWAEPGYTGPQRMLREKVEKCWQTYLSKLNGLSIIELVPRLGEINATRLCYEMLMKVVSDDESTQVLLRLPDPLKEVRDQWMQSKELEDTDDFICELNSVQFYHMGGSAEL